MNYTKLHFFVITKMNATKVIGAFIAMPITNRRTHLTNFYGIVMIITISPIMCPVRTFLFIHYFSSFKLKFKKLLSLIQQHNTDFRISRLTSILTIRHISKGYLSINNCSMSSNQNEQNICRTCCSWKRP